MIKSDLSDSDPLTALILGLFKGGLLEAFAQTTLDKLKEWQDRFQKAKDEADKPSRLRVDRAPHKYTGNDPFGGNKKTSGRV